MIVLDARVNGDAVTINVPERDEDLEGLHAVLADPRPLGFDTETTGLDVFAPGHRCRLVQIGRDREAWVLDAERFAPNIRWIFNDPRQRWIAHNATYDALVLDRHFEVPSATLLSRCTDTYTLGHLLDPRKAHEGGTGLKLKELAQVYVDPDAMDPADALMSVFREHGGNRETGWALVPTGDRTYLRYAGLDPIWAYRLHAAIAPLVTEIGLDYLHEFEQRVQIVLARMQRRGVRVDVPFTEALSAELADEAARYSAVAADLGVANPNSTDQVTKALVAMGEDLTERTPTGKLKADTAILLALADIDRDWNRIGAREANPLADAIVRAKRAEKWRSAYTQAFLDLRDGNDRLHANINGLAARTARMSISAPPLQQLPSNEARIRRCLVADDGQVIFAADYAQIEMRILAALCQDRRMIEAIASGEDLHGFTARQMFGDEFTPRQRKLAKGVGFGKVYGGGADTLARQTGASLAEAKAATRAYDRTFPGVRRYAQRLQTRAKHGTREVVTPSGRHLPLDRDRIYSATNYVVQSTARDAFAQALLHLDEAGLGDHILLPVHDEFVGQAPFADAAEVLHAVQGIMRTTFKGVLLETDGKTGIRSWGSLYGADE
jgi:DNA polymerase-1